MYTRAREGGRRSEEFRGGREERLWGEKRRRRRKRGIQRREEERWWGRREGSEEEGDKDVDERGSAVAYQFEAFEAPSLLNFFSFPDKIWYGDFSS